MNNIMVDCETLGVGKRCVLLDIALVQFDLNTGEIGKTLHILCDRKSQEGVGRSTDQSTIDWWDKQSPEAKEILEQQAKAEGISWSEALKQMSIFIRSIRNATLWSNGANFDIAILEEAYHQAGMSQPWAMWKTRCVRTLHDEVKDITGISFKYTVAGPEVAHNSIEDCKYQIRYVVEAHNLLKRAVDFYVKEGRKDNG